MTNGENGGRLALLKRMMKLSQAVKTMQTVNTAPTATQPMKTPIEPLKNATPAPAKPPTQPTQPVQPNPGQPAPAQPMPVQPTPAQPPTNPTPAPGTPANPQVQASQQFDQFGNPIEKKESPIYGIVKNAIEQKTLSLLKAARYYRKEDNKKRILEDIQNKAVAIYNSEGELLKPYIIKTEADYDNNIKVNAVSIFEPVGIKTKSFRIMIESKNKNEAISNLRVAKLLFDKLGFASRIIKSSGEYCLSCSSDEEHDTLYLFNMANEKLSSLKVNLSELQFGMLKRSFYSLNTSGDEDTIIATE